MRAAAAKMKQIEAEEATTIGTESPAVAVVQPVAVAAAAASRAPVTPPSAGQRQQQEQVFSAEALALAKAFMEQEDSPPRLASAPVHMLPATASGHAATSATVSVPAPHGNLPAGRGRFRRMCPTTNFGMRASLSTTRMRSETLSHCIRQHVAGTVR